MCPGPERSGLILPTAALAVLAPGQLQAVLAHERAHHHLTLTLASALADDGTRRILAVVEALANRLRRSPT